MKQSNFLQVYDLELTTRSPLHIGDGKTILKNSFLYDPLSEKVTIFDEEKLFSLLLDSHKVDAYEGFMLGSTKDLDYFLRQICHFTPKDWNFAVRYTLDARNAFDKFHSRRDIQTFVRNAYGQVYIPGSSIKGALRTVLLNEMILTDSERTSDIPNKANEFDSMLSKNYLHTLDLKTGKPENMVNRIMRGIQISDSVPILDENMILTMKQDAHVDGSFSSKRGIVCRESIRPGTQIRMKLTLDQSILQGKYTKKSIAAAIDQYDAYYWDTYMRSFDKVDNEADVSYTDSLILGGGSGFFSKTLVYPYLGKKKAVEVTANMMKTTFKKHDHCRDVELGISPHTMEYARYNGKYYPMGLCEVKIL